MGRHWAVYYTISTKSFIITFSYYAGLTTLGTFIKFDSEAQYVSCDVIKMREMRGKVGKKTPVKEMDNPLFL